MFEGIGRIGAYTAQQNLRLEAKYKLKTGRRLKDMKADLDRSMREALAPKAKQASSMSDSAKVSIIRQKLRQGRKLSAGELKFLKDKDERLYEKAKKAEEAREELQRALKQARSKDEARRALVQAQMKVASEAQLDAKGAGGDLSLGGAGAGGLATGELGPGNAAASLEGGEISAQAGEATPAAAAQDSAAAGAAGSTTGEAGEAAGSSTASESGTTAAEQADAAREEGSDKAGQAKDPQAKDGPLTSPFAASDSQGNIELPGEKYLFMLAALQDEWKRFVQSKEYDELPEWSIHTEEEQKTSRKPHYRTEKAAAENIICYRRSPGDLLPGDLFDLRVETSAEAETSR